MLALATGGKDKACTVTRVSLAAHCTMPRMHTAGAGLKAWPSDAAEPCKASQPAS